mgnify:CR=1 FL=1
MKSMANKADREELIARLKRIEPDTRPAWGRMSAPQMIVHLIDQMHHPLGDATAKPIISPMRLPGIRYLAIYVIPWPKGRAQGPPEAFVTKPTEWSADLSELLGLVDRFVAKDVNGPWPLHAIFGKLSGKDWGVFCYKHFDHHIRQFRQ